MTGFVYAVVLLSVMFPRQLLGVNFYLFSVALSVHFVAIYAWNAWFGFEADRVNQRLVDLRGVSRRFYIVVAVVLSIVSLALYLGVTPFWLMGGGCISMVLWGWYSYVLHEVSYAGTFLHMATGTLHGAMGIAAVGLEVIEHLPIAMWFGLLFASGHLVHEAIDQRADRQSGTETACTRYGVSAVLFPHVVIACLLAICAGAFTFLSMDIPRYGSFFVAGLMHTVVAVRFVYVHRRDIVADALEQSTLLRFRACYRVIYALAGLVTFILLMK